MKLKILILTILVLISINTSMAYDFPELLDCKDGFFQDGNECKFSPSMEIVEVIQKRNLK